MTTREFSVYPVWILSEPVGEYAKVRADEGVLGVGRRVSILRDGESEWRPGRVVDAPGDRDGHGHRVWLELD